MKNIKLVIAYDGTDFAGFQEQPGQRTVQSVCEQILTRITGHKVAIHGSGRTDSGVHAMGQVCNFETTSLMPGDRYAWIHKLPRDLFFINSEEVANDFHARKSARWKCYRYTLDHNRSPSILDYRFRTHFPYQLDLEVMRKAAHHLIGTHDFTSFCNTKTFARNKVRTIYDIKLWQEDNATTIEITGNGFLYNMVRIIVGTLCKIGRARSDNSCAERAIHSYPEDIGTSSQSEILRILNARDRGLAGLTMPPTGLTLMKVGYEDFF